MNDKTSYTQDEAEVISKIYYDHAHKCADYRYDQCMAYGGNCLCDCGHFDNIGKIIERELNRL